MKKLLVLDTFLAFAGTVLAWFLGQAKGIVILLASIFVVLICIEITLLKILSKIEK